MSISSILFLLTVVISLPMSGVLFYVWHKFGRGDKGVAIARAVYVVGSFFIVATMLFL